MIKNLFKKKIFEWCDNCGQETKISVNGGRCKHCGKFLLPCSLCDMDKVKCEKCKFKGNNMLKKLSKNELLRLLRAYDKYIINFFDEEEHEGMIPICVEEFFNNEYGYYLEVGDLVKFGNFVDDEDLNNWLDNMADLGIDTFEVTEIEDDKFYIKDCDYGILLDENWERIVK